MEELLEHSEWVWSLARRLVGDEERARDVVQEAWVRALRRPPELADDASPRPWLRVVVRNVAATSSTSATLPRR
jgi:DNA-directed RNA polymerase specialized sigma24 family protein